MKNTIRECLFLVAILALFFAPLLWGLSRLKAEQDKEKVRRETMYKILDEPIAE